MGIRTNNTKYTVISARCYAERAVMPQYIVCKSVSLCDCGLHKLKGLFLG